MSDVFGVGSAVSGVAQAAGSVASATIQASAARDAAKMATDSANRSADLVQNRYNTTRGDLAPFQQSGQSANTWEANNLPVYNDYGSAATDAMRRDAPTSTLGGLASYGPIQTAQAPGRMSEADLVNTPGYQFALSQGLQATQNSAAARGLGVSGAALKGAATFATGLADNTYQRQFDQLQTQFGDKYQQDQANFGQNQQIFSNQYNLAQGKFGQQQQQFVNDQNLGQADQTWRTASENRLLAISGQGENAAAQTGNAGTQAANAAGQFLTAGASGAAAGTIAGGNAFAGGINGIGNAFQNYQQGQFMQQLLQNKTNNDTISSMDGPGTSNPNLGASQSGGY